MALTQEEKVEKRKREAAEKEAKLKDFRENKLPGIMFKMIAEVALLQAKGGRVTFEVKPQKLVGKEEFTTVVHFNFTLSHDDGEQYLSTDTINMATAEEWELDALTDSFVRMRSAMAEEQRKRDVKAAALEKIKSLNLSAEERKLVGL